MLGTKTCMKLAYAALIAALPLTGGCTAQTSDEAANGSNEQVGKTSEAFTGYWTWSRGLVSNTTLAWPLGSDKQMTCFLSGVGGVLRTEQGAMEPPGSVYSGSYAGVEDQSGQWYLDTVDATGGEAVEASTVCIPSVANQVTGYWTTGMAAQVVIGDYKNHPNRQCGLTAVANSDPYYSDSKWKSSGDSVFVTHDNTNWYINGTGNAEGWAVCVDVGGAWNPWTWEPWPGDANTINLLHHIDHGSAPLGAQCFLTGIGGSFRDNSWSDGVFVTYDSGSLDWNLSVSNYKLGEAVCVE